MDTTTDETPSRPSSDSNSSTAARALSLESLSLATKPQQEVTNDLDDGLLGAETDNVHTGQARIEDTIKRAQRSKPTGSPPKPDESVDRRALGVDTLIDEESRPEIQNIMEQFQDLTQQNQSTVQTGAPLPVFQCPPRRASLDYPAGQQTTISTTVPNNNDVSKSPDDVSSDTVLTRSSTRVHDPEKASLLSHVNSISAPPPPEPDPEPALPFDFHRFLEQLRHRTADPVARYLRSFLTEFGKKQWMAHEQVKVISDFLTFIANKMAQCDVWRTVPDAEFDNAREGMEKLVMNRLYTQTFSPEIVPAQTPLSPKRRQKAASSPLGPGRKGQHQEDVERDEVLAQKVRIYQWVKEEHLDMKPFEEKKNKKFLILAQQELLKINSYRAPRDKVICVLNCCKVLFGFLRNANSDQSADSFIPLLIYTVLKANPDHLVSNVEYILRFRNQAKLSGEAGYYMSSLMGAVQFIENLDRTNLTIPDEDFEREVEAAVSSIAEQQRQQEVNAATSPQLPFSEKSSLSRPEVMPRNSTDGERTRAARHNQSAAESSNTNWSDDSDAVAGLLRNIKKPLTTIGRMFTEESADMPRASADRSALTPNPGDNPRLPARPGQSLTEQASILESEDAAARQASAEAAEAHSLQQAEHATVVETLSGMFPDLDREVISDVVRLKEGRVGMAVDACLALSH